MKFVRAVLVVSAEALPVKASEPYPVYSQLSTDTRHSDLYGGIFI